MEGATRKKMRRGGRSDKEEGATRKNGEEEEGPTTEHEKREFCVRTHRCPVDKIHLGLVYLKSIPFLADDPPTSIVRAK